MCVSVLTIGKLHGAEEFAVSQDLLLTLTFLCRGYNHIDILHTNILSGYVTDTCSVGEWVCVCVCVCGLR